MRDAVGDGQWVTKISYVDGRSTLNRRPPARLTCVGKTAGDAQGEIPAKDAGA